MIVTILMLMFGLPILGLMIGDSCSNELRTQALVSDSIQQLHIMFDNTRFYGNETECYEEPLCKSTVKTFRSVLNPYLDDYVGNISLAGAC